MRYWLCPSLKRPQVGAGFKASTSDYPFLSAHNSKGGKCVKTFCLLELENSVYANFAEFLFHALR